MFCGKCGNQCGDNETFCNLCGSPLGQPENPNNQSFNNQSFNNQTFGNQNFANQSIFTNPNLPNANSIVSNSKKSDKNRKIGIIAIAAALVAVIVVLVIIFVGGGTDLKNKFRSSENTAKDFVEYIYSGNVKAEKYIEYFNEDFFDEVMKEEGLSKSELEEAYEDIEDSMNGMMESIEDYGVDLSKIELDIADVDKYDEDDDEFEDIADFYDEYDVKVDKVERIAVEISVEVDGEKRSAEIELEVIEIGSQWYISMYNQPNYNLSGLY